MDVVFSYLMMHMFFFFSSRRRHTRWPRDWSSDVCSSDLPREQWKRSDMVTADDILRRLSEEISLTPAEEPRGSAPAQLWNAEVSLDKNIYEGNIGVIASVTRPFCGDCDRTRLTTDGAVRNCLFGNSETSLRDLMRAGASDEELLAAWAGEMWRKKPGHGMDDEGFLQPDRPMSAIGG